MKMVKKIIAYVKLQIYAGKANPSPPIGPALGQYSLNILSFCKEFNRRTESKTGMIIPVVVSVYSNKTFSFITKTPPASILLKKFAGLSTEKKPGSGATNPGKEKVGQITKKQLLEIAKIKSFDLNCYNFNIGANIIKGTARSMGIEIIE